MLGEPATIDRLEGLYSVKFENEHTPLTSWEKRVARGSDAEDPRLKSG